jgi:hypothetical protein
MSNTVIINMTRSELELCENALNGQKGEMLLDIITDQIVLSDTLSTEEKAGAGRVLKFLRSVHNGTANLIEKK